MIEFKVGDILAEDAEALVNTVNCVGIMGRGIALQFQQAFPDNFKAYERACKLGQVEPGRMFVFNTGHLTHPRYMTNFPTKRHWRGHSRIEDIEAGLEALAAEVSSRRIRSVAIPPLGARTRRVVMVRCAVPHRSGIPRVARRPRVVFAPRAMATPEPVPWAGRIPPMTPGRAGPSS